MEIMLKGGKSLKHFVKSSLKPLFCFFLLWNWMKTQKNCHDFINKDFHKDCPAASQKNLVPNITTANPPPPLSLICRGSSKFWKIIEGESKLSCKNGVVILIRWVVYRKEVSAAFQDECSLLSKSFIQNVYFSFNSFWYLRLLLFRIKFQLGVVHISVVYKKCR